MKTIIRVYKFFPLRPKWYHWVLLITILVSIGAIAIITMEFVSQMFAELIVAMFNTIIN